MTVDQKLLISNDYRSLLVDMHSSALWGDRGYRYLDDIVPFFDGLAGCRTVLDYGSGQEGLRVEFTKVRPCDFRCYDPAIAGRDEAPEPADLVVCTDVLEHIEPKRLKHVLPHIFGLGLRAIYLRWGLAPAKRRLPDGRNAHLIVQPAAWWMDQLQQHSTGWTLIRSEAARKTAGAWYTK